MHVMAWNPLDRPCILEIPSLSHIRNQLNICFVIFPCQFNSLNCRSWHHTSRLLSIKILVALFNQLHLLQRGVCSLKGWRNIHPIQSVWSGKVGVPKFGGIPNYALRKNVNHHIVVSNIISCKNVLLLVNHIYHPRLENYINLNVLTKYMNIMT